MCSLQEVTDGLKSLEVEMNLVYNYEYTLWKRIIDLKLY